MADDTVPLGDVDPLAAVSRDSEAIVFKDPDAPPPAAAAPGPGEAAAGGVDYDIDGEPIERPPQFEVHYTCLRCGTDVSNAELDRLPEIKCICGYKVFVKVRPPIVKTVSAT